MTHARPFSKLKKQLESLFIPELKMRVNCISYPIRSQYGSSSIPRFYVQLGKEIIWDFPKDFPTKDIHYHYWREDTGISNLIREYVDTPIVELLSKNFEGEHIRIESKDCDFYLGLTDIFIAADRRIGKEKITALMVGQRTLSPTAQEVFHKRLNMTILKRFHERSKLGMEVLSKQPPVTLEEARAQVLWLKIRGSGTNKEQEIKKLLKIYHLDWTEEQIDIESIRLLDLDR